MRSSKRVRNSHNGRVFGTYEDIRNDFENLNDDTQLALFFTKVLERRDLIDDLTTPKGTTGQKELLPE